MTAGHTTAAEPPAGRWLVSGPATFATIGFLSQTLSHLGPITRPLAPWCMMWLLLVGLTARNHRAARGTGAAFGARCLATAATCYLAPDTLTGRSTLSWPAVVWLIVLAAAAGALAATAARAATTPARTTATTAAASALFLAEPALHRQEPSFALALGLGCAAATALQSGRARTERLRAAALALPLTIAATTAVLAAPVLFAHLPGT
ncbi:hypothetical protein GCM10020229_38940 [Kitasatospora albolonga]|uniref:hypothetical protein n=1 Tax=Kitasatospora albolonga TaxID=68173 RepID=UPI0031ED5550